MKNLTVENIAKSCNGQIFNYDTKNEETITGVSIDSRKIEKGNLYIPFVGERVDGHSFIEDVFEKGALVTLSEKDLEINKPYIKVESTAKAIKDIALFYRESLDIKVVGITGSVGKTSTKELVAAVLSEKYKVLKTDGNYNNEIGIPLTIFNLTDEDEIAVLEMGISEFGEMHREADIARPDVCIITNIGTCHLENLGDRDGVFRAKTEMFDHMKDNGAIILNGNDDKLINVKEHNGIIPMFYGDDDSFTAFPVDIENLGLKGTKVTINCAGQIIDAKIPIPGKHMVGNALAASLAGDFFGLTSEEIKRGIEKLKPVTGRNNIFDTDKYTVIDDCYNANPMSMKASIDVLVNANTRKVAILGDMFELGDDEVKHHEDIGTYAASRDIDKLICVGTLSKNMFNKAKETDNSKEIVYFETLEDLLSKIDDELNDGDTVLIKASNGMKFKEIVAYLKNE